MTASKLYDKIKKIYGLDNEFDYSEAFLLKDVKQSIQNVLRRLKEETSLIINNIKKNGKDKLSCLNSAYAEFINELTPSV